MGFERYYVSASPNYSCIKPYFTKFHLLDVDRQSGDPSGVTGTCGKGLNLRFYRMTVYGPGIRKKLKMKLSDPWIFFPLDFSYVKLKRLTLK